MGTNWGGNLPALKIKINKTEMRRIQTIGKMMVAAVMLLGCSFGEDVTKIPMNIGFKVTFYSQYEEDLWQMQSNVIPFISPFVVVSSYHPYDKLQIIRTKILCDGNFSEEIEVEQPIEEFQIYKCSINLYILSFLLSIFISIILLSLLPVK